MIDGWAIYFGIALRWVSLNLTDHKSPLVQVMPWCRQVASHWLSQCWPRYGQTRQWVKRGPFKPRWLSNCIVIWKRVFIARSCPNFNFGSGNFPLKLENGWLIPHGTQSPWAYEKNRNLPHLTLIFLEFTPTSFGKDSNEAVLNVTEHYGMSKTIYDIKIISK